MTGVQTCALPIYVASSATGGAPFRFHRRQSAPPSGFQGSAIAYTARQSPLKDQNLHVASSPSGFQGSAIAYAARQSPLKAQNLRLLASATGGRRLRFPLGPLAPDPVAQTHPRLLFTREFWHRKRGAHQLCAPFAHSFGMAKAAASSCLFNACRTS